MRAIRSAAVVLIAAFFTVTYAASGWCQAYPNRTIQLIVAYAAGGTGDIVARSVSDKLGAALALDFPRGTTPGTYAATITITGLGGTPLA